MIQISECSEIYYFDYNIGTIRKKSFMLPKRVQQIINFFFHTKGRDITACNFAVIIFTFL